MSLFFPRDALERIVEQLHGKVEEVTSQVSAAGQENSQLQEELERLQMRHHKLVTDMETKERQWRDRWRKYDIMYS